MLSPAVESSSPARRSHARGSLAWKLPVVMTAIFASGLALVLAWIYVALTTRAEGIVRDRLRHAVHQIAGDASTSLRGLGDTFAAVAARDDVRRLARASIDGRATDVDRDAVRRALGTLAMRDTTLAVELWSARGTPIMTVGTLRPTLARPPVTSPRDVAFTALVGDGGRPYFWVVAPVLDGGSIVGYVAQPRRAGGPPAALVMLRELTREELGVYLHNADGTAWSLAPGRTLHTRIDRITTRTGLAYERADSGQFVAEEAPMAGTPWVMGLASPRAWIVSRPAQTIRTLAAVCVGSSPSARSSPG